jgi:hypothetical protein
MEQVHIYYLHYGDNKPFYVGKTKCLETRIISHRRIFGANTQIYGIAKVKESDWEYWEKHYIALYKNEGHILENKNNGGGGNTKMSDYSKQLIREKLIGRDYPKEWSTKQSAATKGKPKNHPPDRGNNISISKKGKPNPKLSESRTNQPHPKLGWKVNQLNEQGECIKEWESSKHAGEALNIAPDLIRAAARGVQKTAGGFVWKYKEN